MTRKSDRCRNKGRMTVRGSVSILLSLLLFPALVLGAPAINGVSGTTANGQSITISGSGFGNNGPNVVLFDDFERGTLGQPMLIGAGSAQVGQWDAKDASIGVAVYGSTAVSGTKAYESDKSHWSMHQICNLPAGTTKVFMSYYVRMDTSYGTESWKLAWLFDGDETGDREDDIAVPVRMQGGGWIIDGNANTELDPHGSFYPSDDPYVPLNTWGRIAFYAELTTTHSGKIRMWDKHPTSGIRLLASGDQFQVAGSASGTVEWDEVHFPGLTPNGAGYLRHDDVYIAYGDNAMARVEIGNASTYSACTKLSVAVPNAWSASSITATWYEGELRSGDQAYVYIFDSTGTPNSTGYAVTIGGGAPVAPPAAPSGLTVQ